MSNEFGVRGSTKEQRVKKSTKELQLRAWEEDCNSDFTIWLRLFFSYL